MSYGELLRQNLAAESDPRTRAVDEVWWKAIRGSEALIDSYDSPERWVRVTFEVCPICRGKGKHVNPSIDAHGLTRDDFDEDPEFERGYWAGDYDVRCNLCGGEKVVPVPVDPEVITEIQKYADDLYEMRAEQLAELRAGA